MSGLLFRYYICIMYFQGSTNLIWVQKRFLEDETHYTFRIHYENELKKEYTLFWSIVFYSKH